MSNNHSKIALTLIGILIISVALIFFVIMPLLDQVKGTQSRLESSKQKLAGLNLQIESYKVLSEELVRIANDREEVEKIFPIREDMAYLVEGVEKSASLATAAIQNLKITDKLEDLFARQGTPSAAPPLIAGLKKIEEVPYSLELSGDWRRLEDFTLYSENLPYITQFSKLTVTADQEANEATRIITNTGLGTAKFEGVLFIRQ